MGCWKWVHEIVSTLAARLLHILIRHRLLASLAPPSHVQEHQFDFFLIAANMLSRMSQRFTHAFSILAISVLCFFGCHQFEGTGQGLNRGLNVAEDVNRKTVAASAYQIIDQLAKRVAIPFGDTSTRNSSNPINTDLTADP